MVCFRKVSWIFSLPIVFFVLVFPSCSPEKEEPEPEISAAEGLFINEINAAGNDWIELYNSTASAKDLSNYRVYDDPAIEYVLPSGTTIAAKGFLVIYCNDLNTGLNTNFKLTSAGETVYLENRDGKVVDKVTFPALLDDQTYGRYPDGATNFAISGKLTQGLSNGDASSPSIVQVTRVPVVPGLDDNVQVKAEMFTTAGIVAVKLYYTTNGATYQSVPMTLASGVYTGTIPALKSTGRVDYYVEAENSAGEKSTHPTTAPAKTDHYLLNTDALPQLRINEFMAFNSSCCPDKSSGVDEFDDWIEIYNAGSTSVNIAGFYFSDDISNPFNSKIASTNASNTTIEPGKFLIIWADGSRAQGENHLDFGLSSAGESVGIYYIDGRKIDEFTFGPQSENSSLGRKPDGTGSFQLMSSPTPGASNN